MRGGVGPPWTPDELVSFFQLLKIEKKSFVEIARVLARRTPEMVAAMYARHRNVLQNEAIDKKMFLAAALDLQNNLVQAVDVQEVHNSSIVEARISSANNSIGMNTNKKRSSPQSDISSMGSIKKRALPFSNAERTEPLTLATSVLSPQDVVLTKAAVIQQGIPLLEVTNADETSNSHFRLRRPIPQRLTPLSSASLTAPTVAAGLIPMRSVPQAATIISGSASRNSRIDMARSIPASISEGITPLSSEYSKQFTTVLPSVITANISNSYESFSNQDALSEASSTSPRPLDIKPKPMKDLGKKGIESWNHFYTHIEKARVSTVSIGFLKWCFHEFFYTAIESIYFSKNEFIDILKILGILPSQKISRKYLGMLRRILGKPRRTSRKFFEEQREKFASYKDVVRKLQNKQSDSSVLTPPTEGVPHLLSPGAIVSAFHPLTRYIHEGIVEGFGFGFYVIRFEHEELGTMTVEDDEVMGQEPLFSILDFDTDDSSLFHKYRSLDIYRCARFQTLLDQKRSIIDHLVQINNAFDAYRDIIVEDCDKQYFQTQFSWILNKLERVDMKINFFRSSFIPQLLKSKNGKSSDVDISRDASEAAAIMASQIISEFYPFETTSSHDTSKEIRNLMVNSATLILRLKECLADKLHARDLIKFSEALTPTMPSNLKRFEEIQETIKWISDKLS